MLGNIVARNDTRIGNGGGSDAFGRLRVSNPTTLFDSKQIYDKQPQFYDEELYECDSTYSQAGAKTTLTLQGDGILPGYGIRQTRMRFPYQPGKSQDFKFTFRATQQANVIKRMGPVKLATSTAAPVNGIFFEVTGTDCAWNVVKEGSVTRVPQSAWNVDKLDGTGPSSLVLDLDAPQIAACDFGWLGLDDIRCWFKYRGVAYHVHTFHTAGESGATGVYMASPNLPMSYSIKGQTAGATGYLDHICCSVTSEGGVQQSGHMHSHSNGTTTINCTATNTVYALLGIRLNSAALDAHVQIQGISAVSTSTAKDYLMSLIINPTFGSAPTWSAGVPVDVFTGATAITVTGGTTLYSTYVNSDSFIGVPIELLPNLGAYINGTSDVIVIACHPLNSNTSVAASINWVEME